MRLIYLMAFLLVSTLAEAQTNKNVVQVLEFETGCPLPSPTKEKASDEKVGFNDMPVFAEAPPAPPPPVKKEVPSPAPTEEVLEKHLQNLEQYFLDNPVEVVQEFGENEFFQDEQNLWGLRTKSGKALIEPTFEFVSRPGKTFQNFMAYKKGSAGFNLFDVNGKQLLSNDYNYISRFPDANYARTVIGNKSGIASFDNSVTIEPVYQGIDKVGDFWVIRKNDLWGLLDKQGQVLIEPTFKHFKRLKSNNKDAYFCAAESNGELTIYKGSKVAYKLGIAFSKYANGYIFHGRYLYYEQRLIDLKKQQYLFCDEKLKIEKSEEVANLFSIRQKQKTWIFDAKGLLFFQEPIVDRANKLNFHHGPAPIAKYSGEKNDRGVDTYQMGLLNKELKWVVSPQYLLLNRMRDTSLYIGINNKGMSGVLNAEGKEVIPFVHPRIKAIGRRLLVYKNIETHEVKVSDLAGKTLFETTLPYKDIYPKAVGYRTQRLSDKKSVLLNEKLEEIYEKKFNNVGKFGAEAIWIDRFGETTEFEIFDFKGQPYPIVIDGKPRTDLKKVKRVVKTAFFHLQFSDGGNYIYNENTKKVAAINPEIGYINGDLLATHGVLFTAKSYNKSMGMIDTQGTEILPPTFENISRIYENVGMFSVRTKEKTHIYSSTGKEIFSEYESASFLFGQFFSVKKNKKYGVVKTNGEIVIPFKYKRIKKKHPTKFEVTTFEGKKIIMGLNGEVL